MRNGYLIIIVFFSTLMIIPITSRPINTSPSLEFAMIDYDRGWGACYPDPNDPDFHSEGYTILRFTMGLANVGTTTVELQQVNITFMALKYRCGYDYITRSYDEEFNLPISLKPSFYVLYDVSCPKNLNIMNLKINISANNKIISFGRLSYNNTYDNWQNWNSSSYKSYISQTTDLSFAEDMFLFSITILVFFNLLRRRKTNF